MSDEEKDAILERAARAYRERHDGASPGAARTRARILATRARDRQRAIVAMAAAAVLAIGLGAPTAWAWSTGRLAAWLGGAADDTSEPAGEESAPVRTGDRHGSAVPSELEPVPSEPEPTSEVSPSVLPTATPEPTPSAAPIVASPIPDTDEADALERDPVDPTERRVYREAHALHFDARDPGGAVEAWDRYLASYPRGRFAIEARYNRALCLVRLDRGEEARAALAPFAEGRHGEYRRREAVALIEALAE